MSDTDNGGWEDAVTGQTIADLDHKLMMTHYRNNAKKMRSAGIPKDMNSVLSGSGLIVDGKLTNACSYLLSKHGPITLNMISYATDARIRVLEKMAFRGNIFECIDASLSFINKNIHWRAEQIRNSVNEIPEIPQEALEEVIVNAFMHCDYSSDMEHEIIVTPESVEIINPGEMGGSTHAAHFLGTAETSPRNKKITGYMRWCGMSGGPGGLRKASELCRDNGTAYGGGTGGGSTFFVFHRKQSYMSNRTFMILREDEYDVYELLRMDGSLTAEQIAEHIGKDKRTVFRKLDVLKEKELIRREGTKRSGWWETLL
jgi:ATP-dependent DNA helicase RecG